jgi:hypothetical protein
LQRRTQRHDPLIIEPLEARQMMAADLTVTGSFLNADHALDPSQSPSMDVTIKNLNGFWFLDDAGAFSVHVVISDDQTITADDPVVGTASLGGLGAGQTTTVNVNLPMSYTEPFMTDNEYWLGVIVDPYNSVSESNEGNNIRLADRVSTEHNLPSPVDGTAIAQPLAIGSTVSDSIGGGHEWLDGRDIDMYAVGIAAGQSVAFDFDSPGVPTSYLDGYMRLYNSSWTLIAENNDGGAPGEGYTYDPFLWGTFATGGTYYLVVSAKSNAAADPRQFAGRVTASTGPYTISAVVLLPAPSQADMPYWCDTGMSNSDNVTAYTRPQFDFTGTPGKTGQLLIDGSIVATAGDSGGGNYHITTPLALRDGFHYVSTRMLDQTTGYTGIASQSVSIWIDTTRPATPAAPDLTAASDRGVSNTDNITNVNTPTLTGTAEANGQVKLFVDAGGSPVAIAPVAVDGTYTITDYATLPDGPHSFALLAYDVAGNQSLMSPSTSVTIDTTAPALTTPMSFGIATAPHTLTLNFSEDVGQTLATNDFAVLDRATNGTVGLLLAYDPTTRTATFVPSSAGGNGTTPQTFAEGNYRAILSGAGVTDVAGNAVAGNPSLDFFFMTADANQDRTVDLTDFTVLAASFNGTGKRFSQGDFNYDSAVDLTDFTMLAANFNRSLPAPSATTAAATTTTSTTPRPASAPTATATTPFGSSLVRDADPASILT